MRLRYQFTDPYTGEKEEILIENTETRDQPKNKENALRQLRSILYAKELEHRMAEQAKNRSRQKKIEWGSQIRSYVFDDRRVKDHRTNWQTSDVGGVMDGDLDGFIKPTRWNFLKRLSGMTPKGASRTSNRKPHIRHNSKTPDSSIHSTVYGKSRHNGRDIAGTESPGHATVLARARRRTKTMTAFLACGGDGTVNETARGLVGTQHSTRNNTHRLEQRTRTPPLAYLSTQLPLVVIAERNIINADYGTANDKPFFRTFGVGFDAAVSERFARQKTPRRNDVS